MTRPRGQRREIHALVPTPDGHKVAVRSRTVAGRLFAQQQKIEEQARQIVNFANSGQIDAKHIRELEAQLQHLTRQRLVRFLLWSRLISVLVPRAKIVSRTAEPAIAMASGPKQEEK